MNVEWEVVGESFPILKVMLGKREKVYAEAGAMMMMKGVKVRTIQLDSEESPWYKAAIEAIARKLFTGESIFHNLFEGPGEVWLTPSLPGQIAYVELKGEEWIIQDYSYFAHHGDVKIDLAWKGKKGIALGDLVWLKVSGKGGVWVSAYGDVMWVEIPKGEETIIDNMHFVAIPESAKWEVTKLNLKTFLLGGEGYAIKVKGPTKVLIQTRILPPLAKALARFMPSQWASLLSKLA